MITAQLGPPPAVPGRASTAEGSAGEDAPGTSTATEDGAFVALLLGIGPSADGADDAPHPHPQPDPSRGSCSQRPTPKPSVSPHPGRPPQARRP